MARNSRTETGDGDVCPIVRAHGQMLVLNGGKTQYCPHQSHDGVTKDAGKTKEPATRALWPVQFFRAAAEQYTSAALPDLDALIDLPDLDMESLLA